MKVILWLWVLCHRQSTERKQWWVTYKGQGYRLDVENVSATFEKQNRTMQQYFADGAKSDD